MLKTQDHWVSERWVVIDDDDDDAKLPWRQSNSTRASELDRQQVRGLVRNQLGTLDRGMNGSVLSCDTSRGKRHRHSLRLKEYIMSLLDDGREGKSNNELYPVDFHKVFDHDK